MQENGSDPLLGLLNLRNILRDQVLSSPAHWLMSRCTRCVLPVAKKLLIPKLKHSTPGTFPYTWNLNANCKCHMLRSACQASPTSPSTPSCATSNWQRERKEALSSNQLYSHGRILRKPKERSIAETEENSCLSQNWAPAKLACPAATDYGVLSVPSSHVMPPSFQSPPEQVLAKQFKCLGWPCPATLILLLFETPIVTLCLLASPNTWCGNACFGVQVSSKYTMPMSPDKDETAVHRCDPALSVLVRLVGVSRRVSRSISLTVYCLSLHFWLIRSLVDYIYVIT